MLKKFMKKEINLVNVVLCMLVVFIHIASEAISTLRVSTWQHLSIYIPHKLSSFVVYGFIFISGIKLFIKDTKKIELLEYYKSRIRKIIIPYILSVCVYYIYFIFKNYFNFSMLEFIKYIITGDLVAHFYFIIIIAQFYLLFPIWKKLIKSCNPLLVVGISFIITIFFTKYLPNVIGDIFNGFNFVYNDRIFTTYLIYWILGVYAGKNYNRFCEILIKNEKKIIISFSCIALVYLIINYSFIINRNFVECLNILQMMYNLIAILFVYLICMKLSKNDKIINIIEPVNRNTYSIYLYHILIIFIINEILNKFNVVGMSQRLIIKFGFVYFILIGISYLKKNNNKNFIFLSKKH